MHCFLLLFSFLAAGRDLKKFFPRALETALAEPPPWLLASALLPT